MQTEAGVLTFGSSSGGAWGNVSSVSQAWCSAEREVVRNNAYSQGVADGIGAIIATSIGIAVFVVLLIGLIDSRIKRSKKKS